MIQTFERLLNRNQGFDPKKLLTFQISLPATEYKDSARITALYNRLLSSFERLHEVKAAGFYSPLGTAEHFYLEGLPEPRVGEPRPQLASINNRYLEALRIPILQGRSVSDRDRPESPRVVVISETIARHYWPKSSPIGRRIKFDANSDWLTIVGVSGDVIEDWFSGQPSPAAYIPYTQFPSESASFALRTAGDPLQAALAVRARIRSVDKNLAMYEVETKEQAIADERSGVGAAARAMSTFALIALLLAATGIYAVVSYFVAARTHDIGVHMALGASRADVLKMAMRQSLRLTVFGLAFGIPLAILLARVMSSALYEVVNLDPATFAIFAGVLALSALLASYLPSRRATRIDPMSALREE
jgi:putative ABC transport system permease protein